MRESYRRDFPPRKPIRPISHRLNISGGAAAEGSTQVRAYCELGADAERLLERAMQQQGLTARAHDRILKVARTIADLEGTESLTVAHLAEAIQYRTLDRSYWA
ncbi:MAG: hypothetical protein ACLPY1_01300 [Terracidiphilus sp.]